MMRNRVVALVGATALVTPLLPLAVAPASAEVDAPVTPRTSKVVLKDATADVWYWNDVDYVFRGEHPRADVLRATARHGARKVVATMAFAKLVKGDIQRFDLKIRTTEMVRVARVGVSAEAPTGRMVLEKKNGTEVSAKGVTHRVDFADDRVTIAVPRRLLDRPGWVEVAMRNSRIAYSDPNEKMYLDHPQGEWLLTFPAWRKNPPYSARIHTP